MEGDWSCYRGGQFNGGRMVMLRKWSVKWRENSHLTEVASLIEGEWSCYRCSLMDGEWSFYGGGQFNGGRMVVTEVISLMEGERSC